MFKYRMKLPPMKYKRGNLVKFKLGDDIFIGNIEVCDYGGAAEFQYHTYDIFVMEGKILYKHVLEEKIIDITDKTTC